MRLALPAALVAIVLWTIDPAAIWERIAEARAVPLLGAFLLAHAVIVGSALRWADTARRLGQTIPRREAVAEYYVSTFLNQVLPGGVAGDAARAWRGRNRRGVGAAARGVVIERLSGQVAIAAALLLGLCTGGVPGSAPLVATFLGGLALLLVTLARLRGFGPDIRRAWGSSDALAMQAGLNLLVAGGLILGFALCARSVGTPMAIAEALVLVPVCLAAMLVPVGVGGIGLREGTAAALWPLAGYSSEAGVAAALLFGLATLAAALPGAILLVRHRR